MLDFKAEKHFKNFKYSVSFKTESSVTALFAPSGSGKSLTLKVISGPLKPDRGEVLLNGKVLFSSEKGINLPPQRRRIGFLFQDYALFPHMTVWENITYASKDLKLYLLSLNP
jgi:molybdate transport system ATP-binding protein